MKNGRWKIFSRPERAKKCSIAFRIVFRILFRVFQTVFRIVLKFFRGANSFCTRAALTYYRICQKTREGCGCFRGLFRGSRGKLQENRWKIFPESRNATNTRASGTGKGKPAGNLGPTLPGPCPHLPCGVFFEIGSSSLLEFFFFFFPDLVS